jgi:hypothetical protein
VDETNKINKKTLTCIFQPNPQNPVPGFRKHIESALGVKPHKHSITTVLQPGVKVKVRVGFQPRDDISPSPYLMNIKEVLEISSLS